MLATMSGASRVRRSGSGHPAGWAGDNFPADLHEPEVADPYIAISVPALTSPSCSPSLAKHIDNFWARYGGDPVDEPTSIGRWTSAAVTLLQSLVKREVDHLETASRWSTEAIAGGGLVHLFGTGHSRMAVEEMFPRYGSFPGFNPMVELSMTYHTQVVGSNGQRQAMYIERVEGLAETILANFRFGPDDLMIVISHGGTTAVPIEMAIGAQDRGMRVVAITSVAHSMASSTGHTSQTRLLDHADLVIDLGTPIGDALIELDGLDTPVGPGSSVTGAAVINEIKVRTAELLLARGITPPVLTASALIGQDRSHQLFDQAYAEHANRLSSALATTTRRHAPPATDSEEEPLRSPSEAVSNLIPVESSAATQGLEYRQ